MDNFPRDRQKQQKLFLLDQGATLLLKLEMRCWLRSYRLARGASGTEFAEVLKNLLQVVKI